MGCNRKTSGDESGCEWLKHFVAATVCGDDSQGTAGSHFFEDLIEQKAGDAYNFYLRRFDLSGDVTLRPIDLGLCQSKLEVRAKGLYLLTSHFATQRQLSGNRARHLGSGTWWNNRSCWTSGGHLYQCGAFVSGYIHGEKN